MTNNTNFKLNYFKDKDSKSNIVNLTKIFSLVFLILLFIFILFFVNSDIKNSKTISKELHILNWDDYTGTPELIEKFESLYGVKVNIYTYLSDYEVFDRDLSEYDLILVRESLISELRNQKLLSKLNFKNLDNMESLSTDCKLSNSNYNYFIPMIWGTTGVLINKELIPNHQTSWDVLWDKKYKNKTVMMNNVEEVLIANSMNTLSKAAPNSAYEIDMVKKFIIFQNRNLYGYYESSRDLEILFRNGDIWAAQAYSDALSYFETSKNLTYYIPIEGANKWIDGFVIPKSSPNKYTAQLFSNFLLEENNNAEIALYFQMPTCNEKSKVHLGEEFLSNEAIYPNKYVKSRLIFANDFQLNSKLNNFKEEISQIMENNHWELIEENEE